MHQGQGLGAQAPERGRVGRKRRKGRLGPRGHGLGRRAWGVAGHHHRRRRLAVQGAQPVCGALRRGGVGAIVQQRAGQGDGQRRVVVERGRGCGVLRRQTQRGQQARNVVCAAGHQSRLGVQRAHPRGLGRQRIRLGRVAQGALGRSLVVPRQPRQARRVVRARKVRQLGRRREVGQQRRQIFGGLRPRQQPRQARVRLAPRRRVAGKQRAGGPLRLQRAAHVAFALVQQAQCAPGGKACRLGSVGALGLAAQPRRKAQGGGPQRGVGPRLGAQRGEQLAHRHRIVQPGGEGHGKRGGSLGRPPAAKGQMPRRRRQRHPLGGLRRQCVQQPACNLQLLYGVALRLRAAQGVAQRLGAGGRRRQNVGPQGPQARVGLAPRALRQASGELLAQAHARLGGQPAGAEGGVGLGQGGLVARRQQGRHQSGRVGGRRVQGVGRLPQSPGLGRVV